MGQAAVTTLANLPARAAALITPDPLYGCWLWAEAKRDRHGYGTYWTTGGARQAHRFVYETLVGPVPAGLVLDHLCRRRACCRPEHLEPVTHAENDMRRVWRYRVRRTTCPNGHTLSTCITTPSNGKSEGGGRLCRTCAGPERDPMLPALTISPDDMRASFDPDGEAFERVGRMPTMESE